MSTLLELHDLAFGTDHAGEAVRARIRAAIYSYALYLDGLGVASPAAKAWAANLLANPSGVLASEAVLVLPQALGDSQIVDQMVRCRMP
jgi:hypothetical protein